MKQAGFQIDASLAGLVALFKGECIRTQVTERESNQYLRLALDGRHELTHSILCLLAVHAALEISVLDVCCAAVNGSNGDGQKGRT